MQDLASQALGAFIDAGAKDSVIDIGSAPGGKAAYMAMTMENKGGIAAIESDAGRARMIDNTAARRHFKRKSHYTRCNAGYTRAAQHRG